MKVKQFVITAVSLLAAVSVFASNEIADIAEKGISMIVGEEKAADEGSISGEVPGAEYSETSSDEIGRLYRNLTDGGYYYDEIKEILIEYNNLVQSYSLPENERERIIDVSAGDIDFARYLEVCSFLKMTDTEISAADEIYNLAVWGSDDAIEAAYAAYKGTADGELTVADVAHYVDMGIKPEEIAAVYELTLKGNKNVRDVLDEHLSGASWGGIISSAYNLSEDTFGENATLADIASVKAVAEKIGCAANAVIEINEHGRPQLTANASEIYTNKQNEIDVFNSEIGRFENLDLMIAEEAAEKLSDISSETAEELMRQGYKIRDIENAVSNNSLVETADGSVIIESEANFK